MKSWIGAVALAGGLISGETMADGNSLLAGCTEALRVIDTKAESGDMLPIGVCMGQIEGTRKTMMMYNTLLPEAAQTCFPPYGFPNTQAIRIVVKFLQDNPEMLNQDDVSLTMTSFRRAYPCK